MSCDLKASLWTINNGAQTVLCLVCVTLQRLMQSLAKPTQVSTWLWLGVVLKAEPVRCCSVPWSTINFWSTRTSFFLSLILLLFLKNYDACRQDLYQRWWSCCGVKNLKRFCYYRDIDTSVVLLLYSANQRLDSERTELHLLDYFVL